MSKYSVHIFLIILVRLILSVAAVVSCLSEIFRALLRVLLLRRAVGVEVVELAAGEHPGVGPLPVSFLGGSLSILWFLQRRAAGLSFRVVAVPTAPAICAKHAA